MTDRLSKEKRSEVMSKVRSKGTKPEREFAQMLIDRGFSSFIEQPKHVKGRPDFTFPNEKIAIFIDSCFWHGCPLHLRMPASNVEYWQNKIAKNRSRDKNIRKELKQTGWHVIRIWEHELPTSSSLKRKLNQLTRLVKQNI